MTAKFNGARVTRKLLLRCKPLGVQDGTGCGPRMVQSGQMYTRLQAALVYWWLVERAAGYPSLKQFEGGANWPEHDEVLLET